jgi:hypothetical protein
MPTTQVAGPAKSGPGGDGDQVMPDGGCSKGFRKRLSPHGFDPAASLQLLQNAV